MTKTFIYVIIIINIYFLKKYYFNRPNDCKTKTKTQTRTLDTSNLDFLFLSIQPTISFKSKIYDLYNLCKKYSWIEDLVVESSIKFGYQSINRKRLTIPVFFGNFINKSKNQTLSINDQTLPINDQTLSINDKLLESFCKELCNIIFDKNNNPQFASLIKQYIELHITKLSNHNDLIVGYDWKENLFKIYIDNAENSIECLEININSLKLNQKHYEKLSNCDFANTFDTQSLQLLKAFQLIPSNYSVIYKVNNDTYHVVLKQSLILPLSPYQLEILGKYYGILKKKYENILGVSNYQINVISIKKNYTNRKIDNLSIYLRKKH